MIGTTLSHFKITAKLGEGGMGEVWRADDTKLDREVAIKVLPEAFTEDPERLARFEREAKLLAQLNHPNVAAIYEVGHAAPNVGAGLPTRPDEETDKEGRIGRSAPTTSEVHFLAMELAEGEDLANRLGRGAIPLEEALGLALQIAEALEAAHEKGIIHRDLKPQNIKLTPDGTVKVLDFGLAKAMEPGVGTDGAAPHITQSPTLTLGATVQGVILGTAAYMSPEQAAGAVADRRSDVWSFGVVLYEMLTGARLFEGETVSHVLAGVLKEEPDLDALPKATPPRIRRLVARCLRKKARERLQAIGDARLVIEEVQSGAMEEPAPQTQTVVQAAGAPRWLLAAAVLGALVVGVFGGTFLLDHDPQVEIRPRALAELPLPSGLSPRSPTLSPDGSHLAFSGRNFETARWDVWIRTVGTGQVRMIAGSENGFGPFWSPDGRSIGFYDYRQNRIERVFLEGGQPVEIASGVDSFWGATWGPDAIVFASRTGVHRVPPSGGETVLVLPASEESGCYAPKFLADGEQFICTMESSESETVVLASLSSEETRELTVAESRAVVENDRLFYMRGSTLLARPFDEKTGVLADVDSEIVAEGVGTEWGGQFAVRAGMVVFIRGGALGGSAVNVFDRSGAELDRIESDTFLDDLALSEDGRRAVVMKDSAASESGGENDVWTIDLERKLFTRVSMGDDDDDPVFSPDGSKIAFARDGALFVIRSDGTGEPQPLVEDSVDIVTNDWTKDGWILYSEIAQESGGEDLYAVSVEGGESRRLTSTPYRVRHAQVSPDERWLAYTSDESGEYQVYLTRWPELEGKWQLSIDSASSPRWSREGSEIFVLSRGSQLLRIPLDLAGPSPEIGLPEEMFRVVLEVPYQTRTLHWDVTADGERFFAIGPLTDGEARGPSAMLIVNPFSAATDR